MSARSKIAESNLETGRGILNMLGAGAGVGAGGMAIYHLLRKLKSDGKKEKAYQNVVPNTPVALEKDAGAAQNVYDNIAAAVGSLPGHLSDRLPYFKPLDLLGEQNSRAAFGSSAKVLAGLAGLYGGSALVNHVVRGEEKQDNRDELEDARQQYYALLRGEDKAAAFDAAFEKLAEPSFLERATGMADDVTGTLGKTLPRFAATGSLLASLAAAGVGAKYMYDRTAERTRGENLAKAREARARLQPLPAVFVDPDELAQIKQRANQPTHE